MPDPFASLAGEYEGWYATPLGAFVIAEEERCLLEGLPAPPKRAVEVGAGTGWWARILAARGYAVTAVEPSARMRAVGLARDAAGVTWLDGTGEDLPLEAGSADILLVMTVLEFAADPRRLLAEAWRVLAPGGTLVVGHLDPASPWVALYRQLGDAGIAPWSLARFHAAAEVASWVPSAADASASCVHLAPGAQPPFDVADAAGRVAGNAAALVVLRWRKPA